MGRHFWQCNDLDKGYGIGKEITYVEDPIAKKANLIGSQSEPWLGIGAGLHLPVIDIDWPCELLPSSTAGHHHLYIDSPMSWREYRKLLKALYKAHIIEEGFYKSSLKYKQTFVRKPGVMKPDSKFKIHPGHKIRLQEIKGAIERLVEDMK